MMLGYLQHESSHELLPGAIETLSRRGAMQTLRCGPTPKPEPEPEPEPEPKAEDEALQA
jgi:hypothetical protein